MQVQCKTEQGTVIFQKILGNPVGVDICADKVWYSYINDNKQNEIGYYSFMLPSNGFQLIGLTSEVSEDQAKMMVDVVKPHGLKGSYFKEYENTRPFYATAIQSFKSLMQHLQVYEVNPYGAECPIVYDLEPNFSKQLKNRQNWQESESKTGRWIVLFKPNEK